MNNDDPDSSEEGQGSDEDDDNSEEDEGSDGEDGTDEQDEGSDTGTDETGEIVFEETFVLSEDRSFTNFILPSPEYDKFIAGEGDLRLISEKVYEYFNDVFDFIIVLSVETSQPDGLFFGRFTPVSNAVEGLGSSIYDNSTFYGSSGKLKGMLYMPRSEYIKTGPFLHEIAHSWGNSGFLPTTVGGHWGYASVGGQLGGFDEFVSLGDKRYIGKLRGNDGFGSFANGGNSVPYGNLELYLMGLIPAEELESVQVAENPVATGTFGVFTADAFKTYTPQEMIQNNGERVPTYQNSQKEFRALTVIISKGVLDGDRINKIHSDLENFSRPSEPDASWNGLYNFWKATNGKATFTFDVVSADIN